MKTDAEEVPQAAEVEAPRQYPESYYQQHRNSILFSVLAALLALPHFRINLDEALFVQSSSYLATAIIPWGAWIASLYSTLHFYLEWRDYAKPHALAIQSQASQIDTEIKSIFTEVQHVHNLSEEAARLVSEVKEVNIGAALEQITSAIEELRQRGAQPLTEIRDNADRTILEMLKRHPAIVSDESLLARLHLALREKHAATVRALRDDFERTTQRLQTEILPLKQLSGSVDDLKTSVNHVLGSIETVMQEPRWIRQQMDLTRRWTAVRVWLVGFLPPLTLCLLASAVFVDSRSGYHLLDLLVGKAALQQATIAK